MTSKFDYIKRHTKRVTKWDAVSLANLFFINEMELEHCHDPDSRDITLRIQLLFCTVINSSQKNGYGNYSLAHWYSLSKYQGAKIRERKGKAMKK